MKIGPLPEFDAQRCVATGWCVAACPTQCLDLWNDLPWLKYPGKCASCAACAMVCPTDAIAIAEFNKHAATAEPET